MKNNHNAHAILTDRAESLVCLWLIQMERNFYLSLDTIYRFKSPESPVLIFAELATT